MTGQKEFDTGFLVTVLRRSWANGAVTRIERCYKTLQGVSDYLKQYMASNAEFHDYPQEWDEEDMGCPYPDARFFSVENLQAHLRKDVSLQDGCFWGPESKEAGRACLELHVKAIRVYST